MRGLFWIGLAAAFALAAPAHAAGFACQANSTRGAFGKVSVIYHLDAAEKVILRTVEWMPAHVGSGSDLLIVSYSLPPTGPASAGRIDGVTVVSSITTRRLPKAEKIDITLTADAAAASKPWEAYVLQHRAVMQAEKRMEPFSFPGLMQFRRGDGVSDPVIETINRGVAAGRQTVDFRFQGDDGTEFAKATFRFQDLEGRDRAITRTVEDAERMTQNPAKNCQPMR